ncbi:hypothetical protein D9615_001171 [Tricholomella constricta]|uniref:Transmembrane protein n=1 Tax=Tricholomella constricta TaxID=117010 RepID=A0A8H5HLI1_9AGAR|nr:hypothetical protein D9615_001171 [Tricholomella constricta]
MSLWNFTIDDTSPYLSFNPYGDGSGLSNGWQTWYTGSQFNSAPGQASRGDSYHITSLRNASVTLQFFGTGVSLFGLTNSTLYVTIDNGPRTTINAPGSPVSLLYSNYNLTNEFHSVTLAAQPSRSVNSTQTLAFDFAVVSAPLENDENYPSPLFYDSSDAAFLRYSGAWTSGLQDGVPNATISAPFQTTTAIGASVSFSFTGGTALAVKGLTGSENGMYSVSLDGSTRIFNGTSLWIIPDALLYFAAGLDPTSTHQLNITNLSSKLCLNSITVFKYEPRNAVPPGAADTQSPGTNSRSPSSINVGIILGPGLGFLFLVFIGIFVWYHQRRSGGKDRAIPNNYGLSRKLTFSKPKPEAKPATPPPPSPNSIVSPMLATLNQNFRFTLDGRSTYDARSAHNGSDAHSSTNLLNPSAGFSRRSMRSTSSSEAGLSQTSHMNSFAGWERMHHSHAPTFTSHGRSGSSHRSSDSTSQFASVATRQTLPVASSSMSEGGSSRRGPVPDYIPMSPRKPLPPVPVPSYDVALRTPELTPDDVKFMSTLQFAGDHELDPAPPQYER